MQDPEDLIEARDLVGNRAKLLAKLEKPAALQHLEKIVSLADAIMVARGDLGVEMPPERCRSFSVGSFVRAETPASRW